MQKRIYSLIPFIFMCMICACEPIEPTGSTEPVPLEATPTQEQNYISGLEIVNDNPYLGGVPQFDGVQRYPPGYTLYNDLHNVLGAVDEYTDYAPIAATDDGYFFDVVAKNGTWGFETDSVSLPPVCVVIRADVFASIVEMITYNPNIKLVAFVGINGKWYELAEHDLTQAPGNDEEYIWAMPAYGNVQARVAVRAHYATAIPGTEVIIRSIYLMVDESGGHCS